MGKKVEMIGKRFGRILVISEDKRDSQGIIYYKCLCDCGKEKIIKGTSLRAGVTRSCGCYNHDIVTKDNPVYKSKLYGVYRSIISRCNCPTDKSYHNYGGRGIKISSEWNTFEAFKKWSESNGYKEGLWIDRINNDMDYSPDNCRWATPKEQQNNKRTCVYVTINGITKTISQWADETGICYATICRRLQLGWQGEDLLKPIDKKRSHSKEIKRWHDRNKMPDIQIEGVTNGNKNHK